MPSPSSVLLGVVAVVSVSVSACSPDPIAPPANERTSTAVGILTSFDRLTLTRGDATSFRASLIGSDARLSSAGLTFASRNSSVVALSGGNGLTRVQGVGAGHTWVVIQSTAAIDSVEVSVE